MSLLPGLWGLAGAVVLLMCCWGTGSLLFYFGGVLEEESASGELQLLAVGTGMGVVSSLFLFIGLFNVLNTWVVLTVVTTLVLVSAVHLGMRFLRIRWPRLRGLSGVLVGFIFLLAIFNLSFALAPATDADSLRHHLAAPKWYASQHGFSFIPVLWWSLPAAQHVLHTVLFILFNDRAIQAFNWLLSLLLCIALFYLSRRVLKADGAAWLVVAVFYSIPLTTYLAGTAYVEFAVAFYALLSIIAIIRSTEGNDFRASNERVASKWIVLAGVFAGLAAATKLWGLLVPVAGGITLLLSLFRKQSPARLFTNSALYCGGALLVLAPWLVRNFVASGDPLWPLLSSFLVNDFWQSWQVEKFASWDRGSGSGIMAFLFSPWTLTAKTASYAVGSGVLSPFLLPPILLAFAPAAWILRGRLDRNGNDVLSVTLVYGLTFYCCWWFLGYHHPRYIQSLHPLFALWSGVGIILLLKECRRKVPAFMTGVLAGCSLLAMLAVNTIYNARAIPVILGRVSERSYLEQSVPFYRSLDWANRNLPENAKVLFLGLQGFYYLDRDYVLGMPAYQGIIDYSDFDEPDDLYRAISRLGWTHVYFEGINFDNVRGLKNAAANIPANPSPVEQEEWKPVILLAPLLETGQLREIYCEPGFMVRSRMLRIREPSFVAIYEVAGEL